MNYENFFEMCFAGDWHTDFFMAGILLTVAVLIAWCVIFILDCGKGYIEDSGLTFTKDLDGGDFFITAIVGVVASFGLWAATWFAQVVFMLVSAFFWEAIVFTGFLGTMVLARSVRRLVKKVNSHVARTDAHSEENCKKERKVARHSDVSLTTTDKHYADCLHERYLQEVKRQEEIRNSL